MAKSKKSGKKSSKTNKPVVKEEKISEKEKKVTEKVTEKKEKVSEKKTEKTAKAEKVEKTEKTEKVEEKKVISSKKEDGFFKKFFAKKYDENESILTIFKDKRVYGALLGEVFGTMMIALVIFTLGLYQPLYMFFVLVAIVVAVYKLSGANLNPINTVGMMATRRMSVIRGVLYLLAQVIGAWFAVLVMTGFLNASAALSGTEVELPGMAAIEENYYWIVSFLEFLGATIVGFFFARAQQVRKNTLAFAAIVAGGVTIAMIVVYLLSYTYFGLQGNFMMNPAIALLYQILPQAADGVGELLLEIGKALFTYVLFPMVGGVVGFYLSDAVSVLAEEK